MGGRVKACAQSGHARGRRAREEGGDPIHGGEDVARPLSQFEVDRHPSNITTRELDLLRDLYQILDCVEFRPPGPSDQPTRPPPGSMFVYQDFFLKGLRLPLHPFFRYALLNLDISLA